jgi:hypothetical protein
MSLLVHNAIDDKTLPKKWHVGCKHKIWLSTALAVSSIDFQSKSFLYWRLEEWIIAVFKWGHICVVLLERKSDFHDIFGCL